MALLTCPNGHAGGTSTLRQAGRDDDGFLLVRCSECRTVFAVDDTGAEHTRVLSEEEQGGEA